METTDLSQDKRTSREQSIAVEIRCRAADGFLDSVAVSVIVGFAIATGQTVLGIDDA